MPRIPGAAQVFGGRGNGWISVHNSTAWPCPLRQRNDEEVNRARFGLAAPSVHKTAALAVVEDAPVHERTVIIRIHSKHREWQIGIRDRVVQGALKLILEPIFEDFQPGSYGYPPASDYLSCYLILIDMVRGR